MTFYLLVFAAFCSLFVIYLKLIERKPDFSVLSYRSKLACKSVIVWHLSNRYFSKQLLLLVLVYVALSALFHFTSISENWNNNMKVILPLILLLFPILSTEYYVRSQLKDEPFDQTFIDLYKNHHYVNFVVIIVLYALFKGAIDYCFVEYPIIAFSVLFGLLGLNLYHTFYRKLRETPDDSFIMKRPLFRQDNWPLFVFLGVWGVLLFLYFNFRGVAIHPLLDAALIVLVAFLFLKTFIQAVFYLQLTHIGSLVTIQTGARSNYFVIDELSQIHFGEKQLLIRKFNHDIDLLEVDALALSEEEKKNVREWFDNHFKDLVIFTA